MDIVYFNGYGLRLAGGNLAGHTATNIGDFPFQITQSGFAGITRNNLLNRTLIKFYLLGIEAVFIPLPGDEIAVGDFQLFVQGVSVQHQNFHPVPQCRWYGV